MNTAHAQVTVAREKQERMHFANFSQGVLLTTKERV